MDRENIELQWTSYARTRLVGKKVKSVRYITQEEQEHMGWYNRPLVIEFDDGSLILPSRDDEGNDGGALFGQSKDGKDWTFPVIS
jgi:hypothetical protein